MKNINTLVLFLLTVTVLMLPLFALPKEASKTKVKQTAAEYEKTEPSSASTGSEPENNTKATSNYGSTVRLYNDDTKKVSKIDMYDYLYGVVAGECPMLYKDEAIKAQIVAAHTYTLHCMESNAKDEYDVSTKPEVSQCYITKKTALTNWGTNAKKYDEKLNKLLNEVMDYVILYNSKPILAAYHALSAGKTESSQNVWGQKLAYLVPVESASDKLSDNYLTEKTVTYAAAASALSADGITAAEIATAKLIKTESGNVLTAVCGKTEITGNRICAVFGLRSCNFDIASKGNNLIFTVRGYGHQVGMSQSGANYMANLGESFSAILKHYYSGVTIAKIKS